MKNADPGKKIYILEADPTRFGGIQQFVRNLAGYLPKERTFLLAYYRDLAKEKEIPVPLIRLNGTEDRCKRKNSIYLSGSSLLRSLALLFDLFRIRKNLAKILKGGDTLVVNAASAMLLFCSRKVLKNNRIVMVMHTAPRMLFRRSYNFGGIFRKYKISLFRRYVDEVVLLSPYEKPELETWLPLQGKRCTVIRHAVEFPEKLPDRYPRAAAVLARLVTLKRIDRVIACAKLLPDVRFNIYGTGPEEEHLKAMAETLPNVCFRGYTNDIENVFRENSVLLITSEYEGYPVSGIEACVHGRPVVSLDTFPAVRDLIEDRNSGLIVTEPSPEALADAVRNVLADHEKFRAGALEHRKLYAPETACRAWNELLLTETGR